ncbi:MAG: WD40 repeat domain-containing protein [Cytophagales bacterium]|nr:MAG: WD40 repeat domain-containing protein [Cytophagales bacterium]
MKKQSFAIALSMLASGVMAQQGPIQFSAKSIVALSDADMAASAMIDGNLLKDKGTKDQLTTIGFPLDRSGANVFSSAVSNSMTLFDKVLAVSNNGRLAFVVEGRGQTGDSLTTLKGGLSGLPGSTKMFTVDLSAGKPAVKFGFAVGVNPNAVTINPTGNSLIVASADPGKELRIVEVDGTGKPTRILTAASPVANAVITDLAWHPGGQFVAYTIAATGEVGLMKYALDATKKPNLTPHGKTVKVGTMPGSGRFSADGSTFVIVDGKKAAGASGTGAGEVFAVQFSTDDTPGEHKVASQAATGEGPESVAISPDGSVVVVVNAGQSYQPFGNAATGKSSLTVYSLGKDGKLTQAGDYPFEGIAPQSVDFDRTGSAIAVAVPEYLDYGMRNGGIEFWSVTKGDKPTLTKQPGRISLTRGCHAIKVIP